MDSPLLNDPEYFECERLRCVMKKSACMENQEQAGRAGSIYAANRRRGYLCSDRELSCGDCAQGKGIRAEIGGQMSEVSREGKGKEEMMEDNKDMTGLEMAEKLNELKYPCRECGEREAVVSKKTGRPLHWMCRECFGDKIRDTAKRKREAGISRKKPEKPEKPVEDLIGTETPPDHCVTIDFGEYAQVLEAMREKARAEVRSVEEQIIWECASGTCLIGTLIPRRDAEAQGTSLDSGSGPE